MERTKVQVYSIDGSIPEQYHEYVKDLQRLHGDSIRDLRYDERNRTFSFVYQPVEPARPICIHTAIHRFSCAAVSDGDEETRPG